MREYAKKIGADFKMIETSSSSSPHWEKFQIAKFLDSYDRIIYLDCDVLIRADCPSLFDVVPDGELGMFNEAPFTLNRLNSIEEACKAYGIRLNTFDGRYFNTGVMVIPKRWKHLFRKPKQELFNFHEQGYLNAMIQFQFNKHGNELRVFELDYHFNRMSCMDGVTGEERFDSFIIHYAGFPNIQAVAGFMERDSLVIKNPKNWKHKKHISIQVNGGLGDQICAQPAIRFMAKNIYPNEDLIINTHFPILFKHLENEFPWVKVWEHGQWKGDQSINYHIRQSLPGPETSMWAHVSNLMSHTVDYCSMALLKRILPNNEKSISIPVQKEWIESLNQSVGDLRDSVLVHCGRHWPSKTFPLEWWQDVVDGISKHKKVCLIGFNEITRGTVPVVARNGIIDGRDILSIEETIAAILISPVLVSNDSSPIHLAGAFENKIILIPTCKHPDHILPFRKLGTSVALFKKLTIDDVDQTPNSLKDTLADKWPGDPFEYLPDPQVVIQEALKA